MNQSLYTAQETALIETSYIKKYAVTEYELMNRAGKALLTYINATFPEKKTIQIICGSGNNGGDGYTLARLLLAEDVRVLCYEGNVPTQASASQARHELIQSGLTPLLFKDLVFDEDALIVDAIFGIGCNKAVTGFYADLIDQINQAKTPVLSVDIPSGLCSNTGIALGTCIQNAHVLSFITKKLGTVIGNSKRIIKTLAVDTLGISESVIQAINPSNYILDNSVLQPVTKKRASNAYKNQLGHVLLIGGDHGYGGAIILAARTASQSGVGLVSVYTKKDNKEALLTQCPECMIHDEKTVLKDLIAKATAIVIGPGLGLTKWAKDCLIAVLSSAKPLVCDADALTLLAELPEFPRKNTMIITPHEGEAKRLLAQAPANRSDLLRELYKKTKATVVLKGQNTLISNKENLTYICPLGNPGLATAGTGDVLAGMVGGFLAQGHDSLSVAKAGVYLHALCGDICQEKYSERSMTAVDLITTMKTIF
tara:strand:+ start:934 stop:2382 length:1449 start_codon:yes stop_codon:yes gene_type:complete